MEFLDLGFADERFPDTVNEDLHCPICSNVINEPVHCGLNEHYFCKACITRHLQNNHKCPCCREKLSVDDLKPPSRFVSNRLSKLRITCDNADRGCQDVVELGDLSAHIKNCAFSPIACSNDGCSALVNRKELERHERETCPHRKIKCAGCGEMKIEMETLKKELERLKSQLVAVENLKEVFGPLTMETKDEVKKLQDAVERLGRASLRKDFIVLGGCGKNSSPLKSVELFTWSTKSWTTLKPMSKARAKSSAVVYQSQIIVSGGVTSLSGQSPRSPMITNEIEKMHLRSAGQDSVEWTKFPATLPEKRSACQSLVCGDRLFVIGGYDDKKGRYADGIHEVSLTRPHSSKLVCRMPCRRRYHGAQLFGDKIVIAGGTSSGNMNSCLDSVLEYDVNTKKCRSLPPLPFPVTGLATVAWNGKLVLIGGVDKNTNRLNSVIMYDVETGKSTMLPAMKHKREGCAAVVSGNLIVVIGGRNVNEKCLNSVEYFSFENYSWAELPPMKDERSYACAVVKAT